MSRINTLKTDDIIVNDPEKVELINVLFPISHTHETNHSKTLEYSKQKTFSGIKTYLIPSIIITMKFIILTSDFTSIIAEAYISRNSLNYIKSLIFFILTMITLLINKYVLSKE